MSTDKSLATLLRALQSGSDVQDVSRLLGSATTLLTLLSNPLNVTLLASQLLSAPAIWRRPDGLRTTIRILGIFNSASLHILRREESNLSPDSLLSSVKLTTEEWLIAVIKGADDKSPRWRHLLVLGGLLLSLEGRHDQGSLLSIQKSLENSMVKVVNLALEEIESNSELAASSIAVVLSHVFNLLGNAERVQIDYDLLLPTLYQAPLFSKEGLHSGYFLSTMDGDIVDQADSRFDWSAKSSSYVQLRDIASGTLVASLGSMSRLAAVSVESVQNPDSLASMMADLTTFTRSLCIQWRQNKLSEIDTSEEITYLSDETLRTSLPLLWRVLKSCMFALVVIMRSLLSRVLRDARMPAKYAPYMSIQSLHILRDLYFISSRLGANAFSQYTFVFLTAIDILSQYPIQAEAFLRDIRPTEADHIPQHPLDRCLDLYFLNTAENFTLVLTSRVNEELLIGAATPYLGVGGDQRLLEIFEAAHSNVLAVLASPHSSDLIAKYIYSYVDTLFKVFPQNISARQFRMAVKTLIRTTVPPSLISESQPLLPSILLELVLQRIENASAEPLRTSPVPNSNSSETAPLSEQSVLVLTLIDALPLLPIVNLNEWLSVTAGALRTVREPDMLSACQKRFWEVLSNGEMDVDCASLSVAWWGTRGGKKIVMYEDKLYEKGAFMSGGLGEVSKL